MEKLSNDKTCMSIIYYDKRICKHLVASCIKDKVHMRRLGAGPKRFLTRKQRKHCLRI